MMLCLICCFILFCLKCTFKHIHMEFVQYKCLWLLLLLINSGCWCPPSPSEFSMTFHRVGNGMDIFLNHTMRDIQNHSKNEFIRPVIFDKNLWDPSFFRDHSLPPIRRISFLLQQWTSQPSSRATLSEWLRTRAASKPREHCKRKWDQMGLGKVATGLDHLTCFAYNYNIC